MRSDTITNKDLAPGNECPECGEAIVTWWAQPVSRLETEITDGMCWLPVEDVEPTGLLTGFSGDVIIIDHDGPSMEQ